jgi:hypothetical protein
VIPRVVKCKVGDLDLYLTEEYRAAGTQRVMVSGVWRHLTKKRRNAQVFGGDADGIAALRSWVAKSQTPALPLRVVMLVPKVATDRVAAKLLDKVEWTAWRDNVCRLPGGAALFLVKFAAECCASVASKASRDECLTLAYLFDRVGLADEATAMKIHAGHKTGPEMPGEIKLHKFVGNVTVKQAPTHGTCIECSAVVPLLTRGQQVAAHAHGPKGQRRACVGQHKKPRALLHPCLPGCELEPGHLGTTTSVAARPCIRKSDPEFDQPPYLGSKT